MTMGKVDNKIQRLYKYRPNNENTLNLLKQQELYFSFVSDFNDPFDCRIILDCIGNKSQWEVFAEKLPISAEARLRGLEFLESINYNPDKLRNLHEKQNFKTAILYCLSEVRDNMLMWSHYANSHYGVCLGFETIIDRNSLCIRTDDPTLNNHPDPIWHNFLSVSRVSYRSDYPKPYNILSGTTDHLFEFLLTKGCTWQYEQEQRSILPYAEINKQLIKFERSALKEVIFESKIETEFKNQVIKVIKDEFISKGYDIELLECKLDNEEYKLNISHVAKSNIMRNRTKK